MTRRLDPPGVESVLRAHGDDLRELKRVPGRWIYVGTTDAPAFQNGWGNSGGGFPDVGFYVDKWRRVHVHGAPEGGVIGTVIFTLPVGYRPASSERFACAGLTGVAIYQIDPNGDVIQIF